MMDLHQSVHKYLASLEEAKEAEEEAQKVSTHLMII